MTTPDPWARLSPELPLLIRHAAPRVVVVGDVILDQWWQGHSERLSREAAAPVVELDHRDQAPGGAGNTAMNLAALGARVDLVGVVGADVAGRTVRSLLDAGGVDTTGLLESGPETALQTVTKTRVLGGDQIVLRIDEGRYASPVGDLARRLTTELATAVSRADAVLICDYGTGALVDVVTSALRLQPRPALVVVDAHDPGRWRDVEPDLVTPNAAEAMRVLGRALPGDGPRSAAFAEVGAELRHRTGATAVVVTLDRDGALLLAAGGPAHPTSTTAVSERHASGAGDTFVAALTAARAAGVGLPAAVELAQAAADVVVRLPRTAVCRTDALVERLGRDGEAVLDADVLERRIGAERAAGKRIVLTNGCFDVLHRGHTTYLAQAAQLGDVLIVALNDDDSVRRLKGPDRPINDQDDRAGVIAALQCVTYVTVFATDTPIPLLERLRPDVYAKGGDYTPQMLEETAVVEAYGGTVAILDYVADHSTTGIVDRMRAGAAQPVRPLRGRPVDGPSNGPSDGMGRMGRGGDGSR